MGSLKEFRSAYSGSKRVPTVIEGASMTQQSFKDECDINVLMSRYMKTGILPENINQAAGQFLDCDVQDFQYAMQLVAGAQSLFNNLPSSIRNRFDNDPARLLAFVSDDNNRAEAHKLGLLREDAEISRPLQTIQPQNTSGASTGQAVPNPQGAPADPARAPGQAGRA